VALIAEEHDLALSIPLPREAAATGFDHVYLTWNRFGHPPAGLFDVAHFDVHFVQIEIAARDAIEPTDPEFWTKAAREPDPALLPADYVPPPELEPVPLMGVHWTDRFDPVFQGEPFTHNFIYGAWDGEVIGWYPDVPPESGDYVVFYSVDSEVCYLCNNEIHRLFEGETPTAPADWPLVFSSDDGVIEVYRVT
jgi:hypothetical protein